MTKVMERLQISGSGSSPAQEDWRVRDVVRTLEEQLVKERAKSQRSASKRCQEQRLLLEQVDLIHFSQQSVEKDLCYVLCYSAGFNIFSPSPVQLDELKASECALRLRVKTLTNELALLRRGLDNLSVYYIFSFSLSSIHLQYGVKMWNPDLIYAFISKFSPHLLCVSAAE